jgi:hypothetical protein
MSCRVFRPLLTSGGGALQAAVQAGTARAADPPARSQEVQPAAGAIRLAGYLAVPDNPRGIVVFAHCSGSSRHSARNRHVAGRQGERLLPDSGDIASQQPQSPGQG